MGLNEETCFAEGIQEIQDVDSGVYRALQISMSSSIWSTGVPTLPSGIPRRYNPRGPLHMEENISRQSRQLFGLIVESCANSVLRRHLSEMKTILTRLVVAGEQGTASLLQMDPLRVSQW